MESFASNTHIHSPYSFSAFDSIGQAVALARGEGVRALGISDFNTVEGYEEFRDECRAGGIYPLFNIEFIALSREDKDGGVRWNDPANPGIMYYCGKALDFPLSFSEDSINVLSSLWKGGQEHIWKVIEKLNAYLRERNVDIALDYRMIRSELAKNTVRERHLAKALYREIARMKLDPAECRAVYRRLFDDPSFEADLDEPVGMQGEIRGRLLKAGKPAFVEEKSEAFLPPEKIKRIILDGGGIPCYPVLAHEKAGADDHESDPENLASALQERGFHAVEFIPLRNDIRRLKRFVESFHRRSFCVTFGTEHNTPHLGPMVPAARNGVALDESLRNIARRGTCILAAHQQRRRGGLTGFVDGAGRRQVNEAEIGAFVAEGERAIRKWAESRGNADGS